MKECQDDIEVTLMCFNNIDKTQVMVTSQNKEVGNHATYPPTYLITYVRT
jgi:hypothetical protein